MNMALPEQCTLCTSSSGAGAGKVACWTSDNTKTLIALVITQLVFTGVILLCIAIMVVYVITSVKKAEQSVTKVANATTETVRDLQQATQVIGKSASNLFDTAKSSIETIVKGRVKELADAFKS